MKSASSSLSLQYRKLVARFLQAFTEESYFFALYVLLPRADDIKEDDSFTETLSENGLVMNLVGWHLIDIFFILLGSICFRGLLSCFVGEVLTLVVFFNPSTSRLNSQENLAM